MYVPDLFSEFQSTLKEKGELWVMNDWYQFYPWIDEPDRIWNIHPAPHIHPDESRFTGDWKAEYNKTDAVVMIAHEMAGIHNTKMIDKAALLTYPVEYLGCSISIMILQALIEGYEEINIIGCQLSNKEYINQALGIKLATAEASTHGAKVNFLPQDFIIANWSELEIATIPYWDKT